MTETEYYKPTYEEWDDHEYFIYRNSKRKVSNKPISTVFKESSMVEKVVTVFVLISPLMLFGYIVYDMLFGLTR